MTIAKFQYITDETNISRFVPWVTLISAGTYNACRDSGENVEGRK